MPARRIRCGSARSRFPSTTRRSAQRLGGHPALARLPGKRQAARPGQAARGRARRRRQDPVVGLAAVRARRGAGRREPDGRRRRRRRAIGEGAEARDARGSCRASIPVCAGSGVPAVGVEVSGAANSAIPVFERSSLSTVDAIENTPGRLALALLLAGGPAGNYGVESTADDGVLPLVPAQTTPPVAEPSRVLVAARDEEERIGDTVAALRGAVSRRRDRRRRRRLARRDGRARREAAGARVVRLPRAGKGQALTLAEREARAGPAASLRRRPRGRSRRRSPGRRRPRGRRVRAARGRRLRDREARRAARSSACAAGSTPRSRSPASASSRRGARAACFPLAAGFGCRDAHDDRRGCARASRRGGRRSTLAHRATGRDLARLRPPRPPARSTSARVPGRRRVNHRGLRLPLVGWARRSRGGAGRAVAAIGLADDLWSGPERGFRRAPFAPAGRPASSSSSRSRSIGALRARARVSGAVLVALARERPQPARHAAGTRAQGLPRGRRRSSRAAGLAVLIAPYDLREMVMLGDAGSNGSRRAARLEFRGSAHGTRPRWLAIGALAGLTLLGETRLARQR